MHIMFYCTFMSPVFPMLIIHFGSSEFLVELFFSQNVHGQSLSTISKMWLLCMHSIIQQHSKKDTALATQSIIHLISQQAPSKGWEVRVFFKKKKQCILKMFHTFNFIETQCAFSKQTNLCDFLSIIVNLTRKNFFLLKVLLLFSYQKLNNWRCFLAGKRNPILPKYFLIPCTELLLFFFLSF